MRAKRLTTAENIESALSDLDAVEQAYRALQRRCGELIRSACFERDIGFDYLEADGVGASSNLSAMAIGSRFSRPIVERAINFFKKYDA